jgi:hypothetical protein
VWALLLIPTETAAEILFEEDFEDGYLTRRGWYDIARWGTELFINTVHNRSGDASLEVRYGAGSTGPWMRHRFPGQDRIYSRYYRKWAPNWQWPSTVGPHDTHLFAMYGEQFFAPTDTYLTVSTESIYLGQPGWQLGAIGLATRRLLQNEDYRSFTSLNPPPPRFQLDRWYCIETLATLNSPGKADGRIQVWVDGVPRFDVAGLPLRDARNSRLQFDVFMFGPYFHGGTPQGQSTWLDALVVATERVGCLESTGRQASPPVSR